MELTDEAFHLVKSTPKVSGFLGSDHGTKPHPVSQSEIDRITIEYKKELIIQNLR